MDGLDPIAPRADVPRHGNALERLIGRPAFWVVAIGLLFGVPLVLSIRRKLPRPLPVLGTVPALSLEDQDGVRVTERDLRGKVTIVGFFFTGCTTVCPMLSAKLGILQHRLRQLEGAFQIWSVSVDPERDTPPQLRLYARAFHARPEVWRFLRGEPADLERIVVRGFHQAFTPARAGRGGHVDPFDIVHGGHLVLVDSRGRIRGYYDSADSERVAQLVRDAGLMANRER